MLELSLTSPSGGGPVTALVRIALKVSCRPGLEPARKLAFPDHDHAGDRLAVPIEAFLNRTALASPDLDTGGEQERASVNSRARTALRQLQTAALARRWVAAQQNSCKKVVLVRPGHFGGVGAEINQLLRVGGHAWLAGCAFKPVGSWAFLPAGAFDCRTATNDTLRQWIAQRGGGAAAEFFGRGGESGMGCLFPRLCTCPDRAPRFLPRDCAGLVSAKGIDQPVIAMQKGAGGLLPEGVQPARIRYTHGKVLGGHPNWRGLANRLGIQTHELHGHLLEHLFDGASEPVKAFLEHERTTVFGNAAGTPAVHRVGVTVGLHVRGGDLSKSDTTDGRTGTPVTASMAWVDLLVKRGVAVRTVFVASDIEGLTEGWMQERISDRQYQIKMLPRLVLPRGVEAAAYAQMMKYAVENKKSKPRWWAREGESHNDNAAANSTTIDWMAKRGTDVMVPVERHNRTRFMLEMFSDINLLASCDLVLGSPSNWQSIVLPLHRVRHPLSPGNHTCIVQEHSKGGPMAKCIGDPGFMINTDGGF